MRAFSLRGVIEGFYGPPYSHEDRSRLITFIGDHGMNCYVYAPKNDPFHRERWRDSYGAAQLEEFGELARIGRSAGAPLVYAIAPGLSYDSSDPVDFSRLARKLRELHAVGVTGFAVLFDDITPASSAIDPEVQARLVARVAELVDSFEPESTLWFIGNYYAGTADQLRRNQGFFSRLYPIPALAYFDAYAAIIPPSVPIMWTGPGVFTANLTGAEALAFRDLAGRPVIVWDNFPVNDAALVNDLFLGPYLGRGPELAGAVDGIVANLMLQPNASRIPVATIAAYLRDPMGYDPEREYAAAVEEVGGSAAEALRHFADQHRGHPMLAPGSESRRLANLIESGFGGLAGERDRRALREYLELLSRNHLELGKKLRNRALFGEIEPWSEKLAQLAAAAIAGLNALAGRGSAALYRTLRDELAGSPQLVAADQFLPGYEPFTSGRGHSVDRFADLFTAIDVCLSYG